MATRTQREIAVQIQALKLEKDTLPPKNMFGTPNHKIAEASVKILKGEFDEDLTAEEAQDDYTQEGVTTLEMVQAWKDGEDVDAPCQDEGFLALAEGMIPVE
jgi:hypothetical protein